MTNKMIQPMGDATESLAPLRFPTPEMIEAGLHNARRERAIAVRAAFKAIGSALSGAGRRSAEPAASSLATAAS